MKFTLFTISNEQIKEQLSKLQTKVESLENMKDVQDKIISAKDSQITFLQGEISTIITWGSIGIAIITALATVAYSYIKSLEEKAKDKIEEAESTLQTATQQLTQIEIAKQETQTNLTESNSRIEQLDELIDKSNDIATVAQDKIDKLEDKQKELNNLATVTITNQKIDMAIRLIDSTLEASKNIIDTIIDYINEPNSLSVTKEQTNEVKKLKNDYRSLSSSYHILTLDFNSDVKNGRKFDPQTKLDGADHLRQKSYEFHAKCSALANKFNIWQ